MTSLTIKDFKGRLPIKSEESLPVNVAQIAKNVNLRSGDVRAFRDTVVTNTPTKSGIIESIYLYADTFWFHWNTLVHLIRAPIAGDTVDTVYFTGDGLPKMTDSSIATSGGTDYPTNSFTLGIPAPTAALVVAVTSIPAKSGTVDSIKFNTSGPPRIGAITITDVGHGLSDGMVLEINGMAGFTDLNGNKYTVTVNDVDEFLLRETQGIQYGAAAYTGSGVWSRSYDVAEVDTRAYVYTYESTRGEEGPPSPVGFLIDVPDGYDVNITNLLTGPAGSYDIATKNIYRTNTGDAGGDLQLVASIPLATTTYDDSVTRDSLGRVLTSNNWYPPPTDMQGLIILPNGVAVGHTGANKELVLSHPYQPHAWPVRNRHTISDKIIGIGYVGTMIAVLTDETPHIASGYDPQSTTVESTEVKQACSSAESIVNTDIGVIYASPDGLILVNESGVKIMTESIISKDNWDTYKPDSIRGCWHDRRYYGFYDTGVLQAGFIFDPFNISLGFVDLDIYATACYKNPVDDSLYLKVGADIVQWDSHPTDFIAYQWLSGEGRVPRPLNFAFGRIKADAYPVTIDIYADDVQKVTSKVISSYAPFRLAGGYLAENWNIQVTGINNVRAIYLGEDISDIQGSV